MSKEKQIEKLLESSGFNIHLEDEALRLKALKNAIKANKETLIQTIPGLTELELNKIYQKKVNQLFEILKNIDSEMNLIPS